MSYALLFAGQGTQHPQMLPWIDAAPAAQPALHALDACIGGPWRSSLATGTCHANARAQPLVVATALAAWSALRPLLPQPPEVMAGYSVGEVAACAAAGACTAQEAIGLARERARLMDAAVAGADTGLLAISGMPQAEVLALCPGLECAIRIGADHHLFGGARDALAQAEQVLLGRATCKRICVTVASHTSWMRGAATAFGQVLEAAPWRPLQCPIALNATGATTRSASVLRAALATQLARCVEWGACMTAIAERQPSCVLEVGGGQALARMWSARHPHIPARSLDDFRTAQGAAAWITQHA